MISHRGSTHTDTPIAPKEISQMHHLKIRRFGIAAGLFALVALLLPAGALAAPAWRVTSSGPTTTPAEQNFLYRVWITNTGDETADASAHQIDFEVDLPPGLKAVSASAGAFGPSAWDCSTFETTHSCSNHSDLILSGQTTTLIVYLVADPGTQGSLSTTFEISGGNAPPSSLADPTEVTSSSDSHFGLEPGSVVLRTGSNQAGAHADVTTNFVLNSHLNPVYEEAFPNDDLRDVVIQLPPGVIGNPQSFPQCSPDFLAINGYCPAETQIGVINYGLPVEVFSNIHAPIYNMVPQSHRAAGFTFYHPVGLTAQLPNFLTSVRTGTDYGITTLVPTIPTIVPLLRSSVTFWGVPADPSHDRERGSVSGGGCMHPVFSHEAERTEAEIEAGVPPHMAECPSTLPRTPFLSNPTRCGTEEITHISVDSWQRKGEFHTLDSSPQVFEGCNQLEFAPSIESKATTNIADSPSGLEFHLHIPQNEDPDGLATAHLKNAVVKLPRNLQVNPSSANGLGACTPAQIGLTTSVGQTPSQFTPDPDQCPADSRIGTVSIETPLLDHPLAGSVFLASQEQNPFGSLLAMYIAVNDEETGTVVKIPGRIDADPNTGQLTTTVTESPQLPFDDLEISLFRGAAAPLKTAVDCGTFTTKTDLTPWSTPEGADAFPSDSFTIDRGAGGGSCVSGEGAAPNEPRFAAGTADPVAGSYSPFSLRLSRRDGSQRLTGIDVSLPKGLIARLAGTTYCSDVALDAATSRRGRAEMSSPSCPASSKVGTVNVAAGVGPAPYNAGGTVYLAGPYKGAPLSLAVVTPAVAGPFDLGTVVVRNALFVDPESAQVHAVSDPFPTMLKGIPLELRSVSLDLDRSQFTLNPTSCDPFQITALATTLPGQSAALGNPFQVGDCAKLAFAPKLSLSLKGGSLRGDHPALKAVLTAKPGEAGIAKAAVTLPRSEFLENAHIGTVCTRVQFAANQCPGRSVYGFARATTPLLDKPLRGPVYLRPSEHKLPDLVADLRGQIHVVLAGRIDSINGGIRSTFEAVPDAPVRKFVLEMKGGKKGLLVNSKNLCNSVNKATVRLDAQNGKTRDFSPALVSDCKKAGKGKGNAGHKR